MKELINKVNCKYKIFCILILNVLFICNSLYSEKYQCEWFSIEYPTNWKFIGNYDKNGVIYIKPDVKFGENYALISIWSFGERNSEEKKEQFDNAVIKFLGIKSKKHIKIEKEIMTNIDNINIKYIKFKEPISASVRRRKIKESTNVIIKVVVKEWRYKQALYFIHNYKNQGILIDYDYADKKYKYMLDKIISSIKWKNIRK